ncbi:hypothetical protein A3K73_04735 [Candidatus Pacearchaeota archaeon RBG_13_36_9]|nr:MAG: hypothetical protein A3K73_04735 [Candidatus Pacearchaeota archaeon RBG_13_36_9]
MRKGAKHLADCIDAGIEGYRSVLDVNPTRLVLKVRRSPLFRVMRAGITYAVEFGKSPRIEVLLPHSFLTYGRALDGAREVRDHYSQRELRTDIIRS